MPTVTSDGVSIAYEVIGRGPPALMLAGLAGVGRSWGPQVDLFAQSHTVILPDHRGTGASERTTANMTIRQHAADMARVLDAVGFGPAHVIGSSTGGAIAQLMGIHHAEHVTSLTIASSLARADAFYRRQFAMRRRMLADSGPRASNEANALFLFDPEFARSNPSAVERWVDVASSAAYDPAITAARIDMIVSHDALDDLPRVTCPTHIVVGSRDFCAPPYFSRELAGAIPGARLTVLDGGHFVFLEQPELFYRTVRACLSP
jgi:aminoacrylate hydrolase